MRNAVVVIVLLALGGVFFGQKHREHQAQEAAAAKPPAAREVYKHDFAKHALDTTAKVKRDVLRQRADDNAR